MQRLGRSRENMGNGYNQQPHHQNLHLHHKNTFLPMLCSKPSIKDVILPKWEDQSMSFSNDPLSPKIGCMGQVKRNNKIVGFPTSNKFAITTKSNNTVKYSRLKKIFSGKNLNSTATSISSTTTYRRREVILSGASAPKTEDNKVNSVSISIDDMDPPLPVIKKVKKPADEGKVDNLWKRRSGGVGLENLQLQQIQLNKHHLAPTTV